MRLLVLSDLHLELGTSFTLPAGLDFDAVVLAGDIHSPGRKAVHWARRESTFGGKPVVYVPGNHEFYGAPNFGHELDEMRRAAEGTNVHLLDRDSVVVGGVRFLGCMLWTDFQLPIRNGSVMDTDVGHALLEANRDVNDFRCINVIAPATRENRYREFKRLLRAEDTLALHWVDRDWLRRELKKPFGGPTVVVTHHAPSNESVAEKYAGDKLTPAFVSHLPDEFFNAPELWLHGHTHTTADYIRRRCRVVSNPRGYRLRDSSFENHQFNPGLIIETTPRASYEQAVRTSQRAARTPRKRG